MLKQTIEIDHLNLEITVHLINGNVQNVRPMGTDRGESTYFQRKGGTESGYVPKLLLFLFMHPF